MNKKENISKVLKELGVPAHLKGYHQAEIEKLNVELVGMRGACESYKIHYEKAQAEIERYKHSIKLLEKDVADAKSDTVKEFAKFVIDKSVKGVVYASDIVDYVPEFLGR